MLASRSDSVIQCQVRQQMHQQMHQQMLRLMMDESNSEASRVCCLTFDGCRRKYIAYRDRGSKVRVARLLRPEMISLNKGLAYQTETAL